MADYQEAIQRPYLSKPSVSGQLNQVAHHLLVNAQGTMPTRPNGPALPTVEGKPSVVSAFSEEESRKGIAALKNNKAAGIADILVEQLKNLGPKAHKWLHTMLNTCFIENKIPKIWRQSKIIAILKPGKDSAIPKNYRPISLLCHTYKLYERLILNRVSLLFEQHLIKEQAGFRPGKSCTSQLLNLTQHIEDGYQRDMITRAAFVDLSAAYDTVNHRILIQKLYNTTQVSQLCRVFQNMLSNRRFYVELNNERSRWRKQKNGLPQGSVLSPILLNIYTNDQPIHDGTRNFIHADDLCVTTQYSSFTEVETTIGDALEELTQCTKRIQPARGWCATVPQSGGLFGGTLCKLYPPTPPLRRPGLQFFGEASRAFPQHGWRSAYSLRETLSPTQDQGQHSRPLHTHTPNHPHQVH